MKLFAPTRVRRCWLCIGDLYQGHGPTAEEAILDMVYRRDRHLKGMAAEEENKDIPKTVNK